MATQHFPILYTGLNKAMAVLGMGPRWSGVDVGPDTVRIRMGWAFHLVAPQPNIAAAERYSGRVLGWGVHGWRGRWLVNGSSRNIVRLTVDPRVRGRVVGFFPTRVREVLVSVEDPDGLIAALQT